jgi:hypothetical protein
MRDMAAEPGPSSRNAPSTDDGQAATSRNLLPIGRFARLSDLSIAALRH